MTGTDTIEKETENQCFTLVFWMTSVSDYSCEVEPLVTVLIPAYNAGNFMLQCLQSITGQTYKKLEILLCDDGSTDHTLAVARSHVDNRLKIYANPTNLGKVQTLNFLLSEARGEYVVFQDADDWSHEGRIEILLQRLVNAQEPISVCGSDYAIVSPRSITQVSVSHCWREISQSFPQRNLILCATLMLLRTVAEKVGGYSNYFIQNRTFNEDGYWVARVLQAGFRISNVPATLYFYRTNAAGLSHSFNSPENYMRRLVMFDALVRIVAWEMQNGRESIFDKAPTEAEKIFRKLEQPYRNDPSKIHTDYIRTQMGNELWGSIAHHFLRYPAHTALSLLRISLSDLRARFRKSLGR